VIRNHLPFDRCREDAAPKWRVQARAKPGY
jgi:hypothetical protein